MKGVPGGFLGYRSANGDERAMMMLLMVLAAALGGVIGFQASGGDPLVAALAAVAGGLVGALRWALPRAAFRAGRRMRGERG